jgi:hypothetical protein
MSMTVRAKNQAEAEEMYQEWHKLERCPECETHCCEHYEIEEEVWHTWEREQEAEPLGDDLITITFNSLKRAQNEAHREGALLILQALRDHGATIEALEELATHEPYWLANE